jgi:signal transduction histidine kinase
MEKPPLRLTPASALGFIALYVLLDGGTYFNELAPIGITPLNPPPGLSVAFVFLFGIRAWPVVLTADIMADILVRQLPSPVAATLTGDVWLTIVYTLAGGALRHLRISPKLSRQRDVLWLLLVGLLFSALGALGALSSYVGLGMVEAASYSRGLFRFWVGDAVGIAVMTPLVLTIASGRWRRPSFPWLLRPNGEGIAQSAGIVAAAWIIFHYSVNDEFHLLYPLFIPMIWIAVRHGVDGAILGSVAMQLGLALATGVIRHDADQVTELQFAMLAMTYTCLMLGVVVTERKELERQRRLHQSEVARVGRINAAGQLAAALAHELNQPLTSIINYTRACQRLLVRPDGGADAAAAMDKAVAQAVRAGDVVRNLRQFLSPGDATTAPHDLCRLLREACEFLADDLRSGQVECRFDLPPPPLMARVDRIQVEQVILNLVRNAIEAMSEREGIHTLTLTARNAAPFAVVEIADTGPGIPAEIAERLFMPFTTGKRDGMGLGLVISRSIAESSGGSLDLKTADADGATFVLSLPLAEMPSR